MYEKRLSTRRPAARAATAAQPSRMSRNRPTPSGAVTSIAEPAVPVADHQLDGRLVAAHAPRRLGRRRPAERPQPPLLVDPARRQCRLNRVVELVAPGERARRQPLHDDEVAVAIDGDAGQPFALAREQRASPRGATPAAGAEARPRARTAPRWRPCRGRAPRSGSRLSIRTAIACSRSTYPRATNSRFPAMRSMTAPVCSAMPRGPSASR